MVVDSKMIIEFLNVFPSFGWRDTWEGDVLSVNAAVFPYGL